MDRIPAVVMFILAVALTAFLVLTLSACEPKGSEEKPDLRRCLEDKNGLGC